MNSGPVGRGINPLRPEPRRPQRVPVFRTNSGIPDPVADWLTDYQRVRARDETGRPGSNGGKEWLE